MDRHIAETTVDKLSDEQYAQLYRLALTATEQLVTELAAAEQLRTADAGAKPGDLDDEPDRRRETLRRVKAGQIAGVLLAEVAAEFTAHEAATAVWLGASLADLGSASGSTRQAARKRWPDLGQIYRTRRWLAGYRKDVGYVIDLLLTAIQPGDDAALAEALDALRAARAELDAEFAAGSPTGSAVTTTNGHQVHWQRFSALVDQNLRAVVELAGRGVLDTDEARFALDGGIGVLAHYDSLTDERGR